MSTSYSQLSRRTFLKRVAIGATAVATVINGEVTAITVTNGGSGYTSPTVSSANATREALAFNTPFTLKNKKDSAKAVFE